MRLSALLIMILAALTLAGAPAAFAQTLPELDLPAPLPESLQEILGDQDHVVGEELCARPGA